MQCHTTFKYNARLSFCSRKSIELMYTHISILIYLLLCVFMNIQCSYLIIEIRKPIDTWRIPYLSDSGCCIYIVFKHLGIRCRWIWMRSSFNFMREQKWKRYDLDKIYSKQSHEYIYIYLIGVYIFNIYILNKYIL